MLIFMLPTDRNVLNKLNTHTHTHTHTHMPNTQRKITLGTIALSYSISFLIDDFGAEFHAD